MDSRISDKQSCLTKYATDVHLCCINFVAYRDLKVSALLVGQGQFPSALSLHFSTFYSIF